MRMNATRNNTKRKSIHVCKSPLCIETYINKDFFYLPTALQVDTAAWRSKTFSTIETTVAAAQKSSLLQQIISAISQEFQIALDALPGDFVLSTSFTGRVETIVNAAYDWNRVIKADILKYDFEPFVVEPSSDWNPVQMEPFERLRSSVRPDRKVISSVSLGLISSFSLPSGRVSYIERKAGVLVEEWFYNSLRGRTMSAATPSAARSKPSNTPVMTPRPVTSSASDPSINSRVISLQLGRGGGMSVESAGLSGPNEQVPGHKRLGTTLLQLLSRAFHQVLFMVGRRMGRPPLTETRSHKCIAYVLTGLLLGLTSLFTGLYGNAAWKTVAAVSGSVGLVIAAM